MTPTLILKKYLYTLAMGVFLAIGIFVLIDGIDSGLWSFCLGAILLSLMTVPIPIALTTKYEKVKDLDEYSIHEALRTTHILSVLITMCIEMLLAYVIIGYPFGILGAIAVGAVYVGYTVSNLLVSLLFRVLPADKDERPLDDLND